MCFHCMRGVGLLALGLVVLGVALAGCEVRQGGSPSTGRGATALVQISMRPEGVLTQGDVQRDVREFEIYKNTQAQLITTPFVLTAALRKPEVASLSIYKSHETDPISWLQDSLEVSFPADGEIMQIRLADRDTQEAAKLVNAVVDAYFSEVVEAERNQKARELADLDEILAGKEREIRQKRTTMKQLADELGTVDRETLRVRLQFVSQQLGVCRQELLRVRSEARKLTAERKLLQTALERIAKKTDPDAPADAAAAAQPELRRIAEEMSALADQLGQVVATLSDAELSARLQNDLVAVKQQVAGWQGLLGSRLADLRAAELKEKIEDVDTRIALVAEETAAMKKEVEQQTKEFDQIGRSSVDLEMMHADLRRLDKAVSDLAAKRQTLEVDMKSGPRVRLIQRAEPMP